MANDCIPVYTPGGSLTGYCTAAVTGKRFIKISADAQGSGGLLGLDDAPTGGGVISVAPCGTLGEKALGVANRDRPQYGYVGVISDPGVIVPVYAAAAISAGQEVMTDTAGKATPYAAGAGRYALGMAMADAAQDQDVPVKLYGGPNLGAAA